MNIQTYTEENGNCPFDNWFLDLDSIAAAKVTTSIIRMEQGNLSNCKSLGGGVWEYKIHFGPGYRVYFGKEGEKIIVLLLGGTKKRQSKDIDLAKKYWKNYKTYKKSNKGSS